jgi:hypothetical protein
MSWARATLLRGASGGSIWQVDEQYPQARVQVGSSPNAGWVVTGPGIALFHVELYWDGNTLYVADPQGVGDVRLNGQPIREWVQVQGRGQLVFGHAIMNLETSVAEPTSMVRDPGMAPRISAPLVGEATRVAMSEDALEGEATRVASSPLDELPRGGASVRPAPARPPSPSMRPPAPPSAAGFGAPPAPPRPPAPPAAAAAPPPPAPPAAPPAPPGATDRPRLGGAPGAFRQEAKTLIGQELQPIGQEATRMVESPLAPGAPAPPAFGAPGPGAAGFGAPASPGLGAPAFGAPAPAFGAPGAMAATSPGIQSPPAGNAFGAPAGAPQGGFAPGMGAPPPPGTGGFAPPPSFQATQQLNAQSGGGNKLPTRTWLMLALFVAVVVAWLVMPTPEEELAASRPATPAVPVIPPGTDAGVDAGPPVFRNPSTFTPVLVAEAAPDGGLGRTPDSIAAQLVLEGHLEDALVQYEALHAAHPEHPEYGVMCEVVRRQLMSRCVNGQRWDGTPCVSP